MVTPMSDNKPVRPTGQLKRKRQTNMDLQYHSQPTPHAVISELLAPDIYSRLQFPDLPEAPGGRTGHDLFSCDPGWSEIMSSPGWAELVSTFLSEDFMKRVIGLFADDIRSRNALLDPDAVYLEPYRESRVQLKKPVMDESRDPNALFFRFDFQATTSTGWHFAHTDHPRRVVGGILFIADAEEEGMEGGEFGLFSDLEFRDDRVCHSPKLEKVFPHQHNKGILLLNCNTAFHGPLPIRKLTGTRKWIYYSISSHRNVWRPAG
jgi:hypothetical protein